MRCNFRQIRTFSPPWNSGIKLVAVVLSVALLFSCTPVVSFASEPTNTNSSSLTSESTDDNESKSYVECLEPNHVPGEMIIVYEDEADTLDIDEVTQTADGKTQSLADVGVVSQNEVSDSSGSTTCSVATLSDSSDETLIQAMEAVSSLENVAYVEPNYVYTTDSLVTPNDEYYSSQYYLGEGSGACGFPEAWAESKCENSVSVAVIDTGCNLRHSDLQGQINTTYAYDATTKRNLALSNVSNYGDANGHGTSVCAIVGAQTDNSLGMAGASWNASILPIRIFDNDGYATSEYLITALNYVVNLIENSRVSNLRVINMSIGGDGDSDIVRQYLERLYSEYGVLNVVAGGNGDEYKNPKTTYTYPSDYNCCLSVTASTAAGRQTTWADYNDAKDITAPGENIFSIKGGQYTIAGSGTSFSAPIVCGAAALMFAKYPSASPYDVAKAMQKSAKPVSGQPAKSGSAGLLNVSGALKYLSSNVTGTSPSTGIGSVSSNVATSTASISETPTSAISMYRLYNPYSGEHFYTSNVVERLSLVNVGWKYEGTGWYAPTSGSAVYRLYSGTDHIYTTSTAERDWLRGQGWLYEGIGWYSGGSVPLYRQFNPNVNPNARYNNSGSHNYTTSLAENNWLVSQGWREEGIGWYALR